MAENVEHLVVAEKRLVGVIDELLEEPPDFSTQRGISDEEVVKQVGTALERVQSPSHSLPKLRWPADQLLHEFETTRERTREFTSTTKGDLRHHFIRHFVLGELDWYQWLLLIGAHCKRHTAQAEAVRASLNFPY